MDGSNETSPSSSKTAICPFLGMKEDAGTSLAFPSAYNYCHRTRPPQPPMLEHQRSFCLGDDHTQCPVFNQGEGGGMPEEIRAAPIEPPFIRRPVFALVALGIGVLIIGAFIGLRPKILRAFFPGNRNIAGGDVLFTPATLTPTATFTLEPSPLPPSATPTITNTPTPTSTPRPLLGLEGRLGLDGQFIIHRVQEGDYLSLLATTHGTTSEAIQAVNYCLFLPIQEGWLIVIPVDRTDVTDLPAFDPVMVVGESLPLYEFALTIPVDAARLAHYNNLPLDFVLQPGDWLLIPYPTHCE